jgi:UDP-glucose 4-epimerase
MKPRLLITGGAGYIGSVLTAYFIDDGHEVVIFDDLTTGKVIDSRASFVNGSILDKPKLLNALSKVDVVIHCAAKSLVEESVSNPEQYSLVNTAGTHLLLEAMIESGVNKIIFSSTAAVYGDSSVQPIVENTDVNPINPYGLSKFAAEQVISEFASKGIAAITFRYFNIAGSYKNSISQLLIENHQDETHLIPKIIKNTLQNRLDSKVEIYGSNFPTKDGSCIRDYLHVWDLAHAHLLAIDKLEKGLSKVFNLGSGVGYSVFEVISEIEKVMGVKFNKVLLPARAGDPAVLLAAIDKAKNELGWKPKASLTEIITSSWQGMKQVG